MCKTSLCTQLLGNTSVRTPHRRRCSSDSSRWRCPLGAPPPTITQRTSVVRGRLALSARHSLRRQPKRFGDESSTRRRSRERTGDVDEASRLRRRLRARSTTTTFARMAARSSWFARERWLCDVLARAFPRALLPPTELQQLWRKHNRQAAPASSHQPREDAAHHRRIYGRAWRQRALHPPGGDWDCRGKGLKDPRTGGEAPSPPSSSGSGRIGPGGSIQPSVLWGRLSCRGKG